jgi:hypothetical protein
MPAYAIDYADIVSVAAIDWNARPVVRECMNLMADLRLFLAR